MSSRSYSVCAVLVLVATFPSQSTLSPGGDVSDARAVLANVATVYSKFRSYEGHGTHTTTTVHSGDLDATCFSIWYSHPRRLRIEWNSCSLPRTEQPSILVSGGDGILLRTGPLGGVGEEVELDNAIAKAAGASHGAAFNIPTMLIGSDVGFRFVDMEQPRIVRGEEIEGDNCLLVEGMHPRGATIQVWVRRDDFIVRRIRTVRLVEGDRRREIVDDEIHSEIHVNGHIAADRFQVEPATK